MSNQNKSSSAPPSLLNDTPEDMLKRVFAVAELVSKSKTKSESSGRQEQQLPEKTQKNEPVVS
jgi:hypothetical protein